MSERKEKIFIDGTYVKEKTFTNKTSGEQWSKLLLSFDLEKFYAGAKQHMNAKGYVSTIVAKRQNPSEHGHTHYVELDMFEPNSEPQAEARTAYPPSRNQDEPIRLEDIPF